MNKRVFFSLWTPTRLWLMLVILIIGLLVNTVAHADTITVSNNNDNGAGSLRQAIADALPGDEIDFDAGLSGATITLTSGVLVIEQDLIITGLGAVNLTISGNNISNVFFILTGYNVSLSGLTITKGGTIGGGGGIANEGELTIDNSTFSENSAEHAGGGIENTGKAKISNSTFSGNSAFGFGGGISNIGELTIKNSIVANSPSGGNCAFGDFGTVTALGDNFSTDDTCKGLFTQVTPAALNLGPFQNNGGPTKTHALLRSSVAIDAVTDCSLTDGITPVETDQRCVSRPQGPACDAGAFEAAGLINDITPMLELLLLSSIAEVTEIGKDKVKFEAVNIYPPKTDKTGCVGRFYFDARLENITSNTSLSELMVEVAKLKSVKTGKRDNRLILPDGSMGGIGSKFAIPRKDGYSDGILRPGEFVDVRFNICLGSWDRFNFYVNLLGIVE